MEGHSLGMVQKSLPTGVGFAILVAAVLLGLGCDISSVLYTIDETRKFSSKADEFVTYKLSNMCM